MSETCKPWCWVDGHPLERSAVYFVSTGKRGRSACSQECYAAGRQLNPGPCPRWCGWEYPGHVNDPKPGPDDRFGIVIDGPIQRARCEREQHDFNPKPVTR